jgi:putative oxidoreductase
MLKKVFAPGNDSFCTSFGLLVLRLWLGLTMLLNHGMSKFLGFSKMASEFPDPLGIGHAGSLALVVLAEVFASVLLIAGAVTRLAAFILGINMAVAFFIAHKGALSGSHSGELAFIYLAGYVVLLIAGAGRFSADQKSFAGEAKGKASKAQ